MVCKFLISNLINTCYSMNMAYMSHRKNCDSEIYRYFSVSRFKYNLEADHLIIKHTKEAKKKNKSICLYPETATNKQYPVELTLSFQERYVPDNFVATGFFNDKLHKL